MKQFKHFLLTVAALLCSTSLLGHDFEVDGIYYQITSSTDLTVAVSPKGDFGSNYSNEYSGSVTIPESVTYNGTTYSVTSIWYETFSGCSGLTEVTIPNSVTSIGFRAFKNCSGLTSVTIPNSVTSIGDKAFYGTPLYDNLSDGMVYINDVLYEYKGTMPFGTSVEIKEGTVSISPSAFNGCSGLASVVIPNSVTSIYEYAFSGCSGLTSVTIGNGVTNIGYAAFSGCSGLTSVTIPNSVTDIESLAFCICI